MALESPISCETNSKEKILVELVQSLQKLCYI